MVATRQVHTDLDFASGARLKNLSDAVAAQEPATLAQLNAVSAGMSWKDNARLASTANVTVSAPGSSLDGVTFASGDRFLLKDQTAGAENGIYIWNGAATPATRAVDASHNIDLLAAVVTVAEGTANADTTWLQTAVSLTLGTTVQVWTAFGASVPDATTAVKGKVQLATTAEVTTGTNTAKAVTPSGVAGSVWAKLKAAGTLGDGAATSYAITHNLGTLDVVAQVFRNSGAGDEIEVEIDHTSTNVTTFIFTDIPTSAQYRYVIIG